MQYQENVFDRGTDNAKKKKNILAGRDKDWDLSRITLGYVSGRDSVMLIG